MPVLEGPVSAQSEVFPGAAFSIPRVLVRAELSRAEPSRSAPRRH